MVTTYDELREQQARAAVRVMGAHHSSWNGSVALLPEDSSRKGNVSWDHTINYHPSVVSDLREMFATAGQQHDQATLQRYREALRVVFHENIHLLAARGTSHAMGADAYQQPHNQVVEEATTELATQQALNEYIRELGLEQIAPGISDVRTAPAYGEYVPAVRSFSEEIGEAVGQSAEEVVRRLAIVNAEDKLAVAAVLLYDEKVGQLAPAQARVGGIQALVETMQPAFAAIHEFDPGDPQDVQMSELAGLNAARKATIKAEELQEFWTQNQDLRRSLDAGLGAGASGVDQSNRPPSQNEHDGRLPEAGTGRRDPGPRPGAAHPNRNGRRPAGPHRSLGD